MLPLNSKLVAVLFSSSERLENVILMWNMTLASQMSPSVKLPLSLITPWTSRTVLNQLKTVESNYLQNPFHGTEKKHKREIKSYSVKNNSFAPELEQLSTRNRSQLYPRSRPKFRY
mgnify:CR=1 FL=1